MSNKTGTSRIGTSLGVAIGSALIGTLSLSQLAAASPTFQATDLASGYVFAAASEGKCGEGKCGLAMMDTDKDGTVSFKEAEAMGMDRKYFDAIDTNGDGVIDAAEFDAHHATMHKDHPKSAEGAHGTGTKEAKAAEGSCGGHDGAEGGCGGMRG